MKKIISLILISAIISSVLLSCGSGEPGDTTTTAANNQSAEQSGAGEEIKSDEPARIEPDLPESDFEGYVFTFLTHLYDGDDWVNPTPLEILAESETGEPINDAVYKRNMTLNAKYNFEIKMLNESDERGALRKAVSAGDSIYDAVIMFNNNVPGIITADLLLDTSHLPYIDLDKPGWDSGVTSMSVVNKNFLLAGDLMILDNEATNAILFNKDILASLALDDPYKLVKENKWTMDTFHGLIKGASSDLNGDGAMNWQDDRWGYIAFNDTLHAMFVGGGGLLAVKDADDIPVMDFASLKNITVLEKVMDIMYDKQDVLNVQSDLPSADWTPAFYGMFEEGRGLFIWVRMRVVERFRGMEANFGILPIPKFDEAQENYHSVVNAYTGALLGVPKSAENLERVSIILEAMAAESKYTLQPAYYEVVLQRKYTRDEESVEMLDIIFNSRVYDIGSIYSFGSVFTEFIALCNRSDRNVASFFERRSGAMERAIDKLAETIQSMD